MEHGSLFSKLSQGYFKIVRFENRVDKSTIFPALYSLPLFYLLCYSSMKTFKATCPAPCLLHIPELDTLLILRLKNETPQTLASCELKLEHTKLLALFLISCDAMLFEATL